MQSCYMLQYVNVRLHYYCTPDSIARTMPIISHDIISVCVCVCVCVHAHIPRNSSSVCRPGWWRPHKHWREGHNGEHHFEVCLLCSSQTVPQYQSCHSQTLQWPVLVTRQECVHTYVHTYIHILYMRGEPALWHCVNELSFHRYARTERAALNTLNPARHGPAHAHIWSSPPPRRVVLRTRSALFKCSYHSLLTHAAGHTNRYTVEWISL